MHAFFIYKTVTLYFSYFFQQKLIRYNKISHITSVYYGENEMICND
jgi:hypothetical protein